MGGPEGRRRSRSSSDPDPSPEEALEPKEPQEQLQSPEEELAQLRRRLEDSPHQVRVLEERLLETKGQLAQALSQNERLAATLREAREQIIALKEEVERLTRPPLQFGLLLEMDDSGEWADIRLRDRKLRVSVHEQVDASSALPGDEVLLGEQLSVVDIKAMGEGREADQRKPRHSQPISSRGNGSFAVFLNSLNDLGDVR
jgi:proteasome-associated ATPase